MKTLNLKTKTILSIVLFAIVFCAIIIVASIQGGAFDLRISDILTKNALPEGQYLATDFFGVTGEIIGSSPVFLLIAFAAMVIFWYFARIWKLKPLKYIISTCVFIVGVVAFWLFIKDIMGYILEHAGNKEYADNAVVIASEVFIAFILNTCAIFATKNFKDETIKKLCKFAIVAMIGFAIANLIVLIVKVPVGRMRYRAMNAEGDFSYFTAWYVINGKRVPTEAQIALYGFASDAYKSFPSGHTCAAGMTYAIMMLPDVLNIKKKGAKFACWACPIAFTGLVAISRIVCGAHYMSDVTFGGTIAFLSMMLVREIFICKGSHFKALFCKKKIADELDTELVVEK